MSRPRNLASEKARKVSFVLSIRDFGPLIQRLQDMQQDIEDGLELEQAVETATGFGEYAEIRAAQRSARG
ncbi:MAG: hypothetical protein OXH98_04455 [Caldilineaceae bacterium]|nr:hypothetical protein [Caldilineaceae bacterium]